MSSTFQHSTHGFTGVTITWGGSSDRPDPWVMSAENAERLKETLREIDGCNRTAGIHRKYLKSTCISTFDHHSREETRDFGLATERQFEDLKYEADKMHNPIIAAENRRQRGKYDLEHDGQSEPPGYYQD